MAGQYDGTLLYNTKINKDGFKNDLASMKKEALKDSADIVSSFNKTAKAIALGAASVGAGIVAIGVKYNAQMEQYNAGFTTMLGSVEKAQKLMSDLKGFAAKTPFELTDLANASTTLLAFGEDVNQLMPDLKMLGDISLGNSEKFKGLALVFGQVQSQGKLMGQDLLQMINQGFNPLQIISEKTGKSIATLKDEMAKGQISFEMVADAMKTATSEGGQFYNAMQAQSKTLSGQWSTLKDNITALTGEMSADISEKLTTSVLPDLIEKVETLNQMWEDGRLQDYIGTAASALAAFGAGVAALNLALFASDLLSIKKGIEGFTAATKAGAAAQKLMNAQLLANPYVLAATALATLVVGIGTYMATHKSAAAELVKSVEDVSKAHNDAVAAIEKRKNEEIASAEVIKTYKNELCSLSRQLESNTLTQEEANAVTADFQTIASKLEEIIPGITSYLFDETGEINLQEEAVNKLCDAYYDLVVAKATASAAESLIEETAQSILEQKQIQHKAHEEAENAREGLSLVPKATTYTSTGRAYTSYDGIFNTWKANGFQNDINDAQKAWNDAEKNIEALNDEKQVYLDLLKETEKEISGLLGVEDLLTKKSNDGANERSNTSISAAKTTTDKVKEIREQELKDLKHSLKMGEITELEYYKKLEKHRDKYFTEEQDEWKQFTEEIFDFRKKNFEDCIDYFDEISEQSLDKIEEIRKKQDSIKENLISDKTPFEYGTINGEKFVSLTDYNKELYQMQRYGALLDELFEKKGELPQSVLEELQEMDAEQGTKYLEALLNSSDTQFDAIMETRRKLDEQASENSKKLMSEEVEEMKRILEEKFGELPDDFFTLGSDSAAAFGNGFLQELKTAMETLKSTVAQQMSTIMPSISYAVSGGSGGITKSTTYTNNYTFNASKDTTTQQLNAAKNAATLSRLRGN